MAISTRIEYVRLEELYLDPLNPRLGRNNIGRDVPQERVLELMEDWTLEELAVSYLESGGFWTQEALIVTRERLYNGEVLVVVEGNRRLAALKYLKSAYEGRPLNRKWKLIAESAEAPDNLFTAIPYVLADDRSDVEAFLGFRHVTGIKEWRPAEKAEFIAKLIDDREMTYEQVSRKIGSRTPTVRQNYIAYRMLRQMENTVDDFPVQLAEERFSVMYLSLRTQGVQQYLDINVMAEPSEAHTPVPEAKTGNLRYYTRWIFGNQEQSPLFTDSRQVDDFGKILESEEAVSYLEETQRPRFEIAFQRAGGDIAEIIRLIDEAANNVELSLTRAHHYRDVVKLHVAVSRLVSDVEQLASIFPKSRQESERDS
ncbi:MAG: hypothetical protein M5U05_18685 [Anaerolineales bacterium]|nr:hypothetical protein [Anaerolineales bacterium]